MAGYIGGKAVNLSTSGADISGTANLDIVDIDGAVNMATTALVTGVLTANGGAVFNEGSADVDFRVESNGNANMLFVDGGANAVGIGTSSPQNTLDLSSTSPQIRLSDTDATGYSKISGSAGNIYLQADEGNAVASSKIDFRVDGTQRMVLDSSGNLLVGKSSANSDNAGFEANASGFTAATRSDGTVFVMDRLVSDGTIIDFRKANTTVGSIGTISGRTYFSNNGTGGSGIKCQDGNIVPTDGTGVDRDNAWDWGASSVRWDDIFATNGTIQTSDRNEKQDIASLTSAEMLVAARISALFKTFRWKDKVAAKGNDARTHTGIIAQDVQAAFTAEGLEVGNYSLFISTTWWEQDVDVPAVEAVAEVTDEDGNVTTEAVEAKDAYTRTDTYDTQSEAPEGATSKTRMGIRYPELLSFVAAYNEQRFAAIETRLTALENA